MDYDTIQIYEISSKNYRSMERVSVAFLGDRENGRVTQL
jgi:hypothetical protein